MCLLLTLPCILLCVIGSLCNYFVLPISWDFEIEYVFYCLRKMLSTPSTDSATKEQSGSDSCSAKPLKEVKILNGPDVKISCPCRSSLSTESMIQVCTFALIRTIYKCFSQYCLFHSLIFFLHQFV